MPWLHLQSLVVFWEELQFFLELFLAFIVLGVVQFFMSTSAAAWANIIYVWEGPQIPFYLAIFSLEITVILFWMVLGLQIAEIVKL